MSRSRSRSRLSASLAPRNSVTYSIHSPFTISCRSQSTSINPSITKPKSPCRPLEKLRRSHYATLTNQQATSYLQIPTLSTSIHRSREFAPPSLDQIRSNLPRAKMPSVPRIRVGTVSRVGTMSKTVQITFNTEYFDKWFKRRMQQPRHILAHEPTGYLRAGDVVHFARFTPATMTDRFESGKLDRRGGGVRFEVHRVMTPFGEALEDRKELQGV
jgi:ribosomal protein S17